MPPTSFSARSPSAASPASGCATGTTTVWMAQMNLPTAVRSLCGEGGVGLATAKPGALLQPVTSVCLWLRDGRSLLSPCRHCGQWVIVVVALPGSVLLRYSSL